VQPPEHKRYNVAIVQNRTISLADDVAVTKRTIAAQGGNVTVAALPHDSNATGRRVDRIAGAALNDGEFGQPLGALEGLA